MSNTRRYTTDEYFVLEDVVIKILWLNIFNHSELANIQYGNYIQSIQAYYSKESFGDLDIIVSSEYLLSDYIERIVKVFKLGHGDWHKNGNVLSFAYKNFQVDLIITPKEHFQTSLDYFAWNDCGNLQGRIAHKLGIKYGHRGAELIVKDKDTQIGVINLTQNTKKIHEVLDLNHDEWEMGFETLEQMYIWISNSKYFNKEIYLLDNRNHYSRTRDNKRTTYSEFLKWCASREFSNNYPHEVMTEKSGYNIREPYFSQVILPMFPDASIDYIMITYKHNDDMKFKEKFNGEVCIRLTGLLNKELGAFMAWAREQIDIKGVKPMFLEYNQHVCDNMVSSLYNCYVHGWNWLDVPEEEAIKFVRNIIEIL